MKQIYQTDEILTLVRQFSLQNCFTQLPNSLHIVRYAPSEIIASALDSRNLLQILVNGTASIFSIREDGNIHALAQCTTPYIIGETDFFLEPNPHIYVTAQTHCTCLVISIKQDGDMLLNDAAFLRMMAKDLSEKLHIATALDATSNSLTERVLNYITYFCKNQTLAGVEKNALHLHCSPRQLQRILTKLVQEDTLAKIGKGTYTLGKKEQ